MKLYFHKAPNGNFGDDMNPWLWDRLCPGWREAADDDHCLYGVGTILTGQSLSRASRPVVLGAGGTRRTVPSPTIMRASAFYCVRGPLTRDLLGLPKTTPMCDPAMIAPEFLPPATTGGNGVIFIPHHHTFSTAFGDALLVEIERASTLRVVRPQRPFLEVFAEIRSARLVVSESLHGAILADAFRVPWAAVSLSPTFNDFKWRDWAMSLGLEPRIHAALPTLNGLAQGLERIRRKTGLLKTVDLDWRQGRLVSRLRVVKAIVAALEAALRAPPQLSEDAALHRRLDDLRGAVLAVQRDYDFEGVGPKVGGG